MSQEATVTAPSILSAEGLARLSRALFQPTIAFSIALMAIIVMMILPMPAWVLDMGLAASFALSILIFTVTLFVERPLDFSSFPTILLASLMLRLSLNVSSTKLIIGEGHTGTRAAGDVIEGFALFVMSGNVFLGLVVFGVLLIVNFIVITKGAARMAEVGARFALDGMPGKQLAIDSDMSAGAIDHQEAKARRERELAETTFFGSLDGASKFVKGDAVAGLLITLLNLLMGLAIGVLSHGMPLAKAFESYAILTVGDGLVTQIPAVIISIASALLLARGGSTSKSDIALSDQLGRHPAAIGTVAAMMALFALVPGLPFLPFTLGAAALAAWALRLYTRQSVEVSQMETAPDSVAQPPKDSMGDILDLDDLHVAFAPDLVAMILDSSAGLEARIESMRTHIASEFGLILPEIRLTDEVSLDKGRYVIRVQGVEAGRGSLRPDQILALLPDKSDGIPAGEDVDEPVYRVPARWLEPANRADAAAAGATTVTAGEVLATHLLEVIKSNLGRLITLKTLRRILDEMIALSDTSRAEANRKLIEDLVPEKVPMEVLLAVLRVLLEEEVSVRNMTAILETLADRRGQAVSVDILVELVRQRLNLQILSGLRREDGTVPIIQLAQDWEQVFTRFEINEGHGDVALPPELFQKLTQGVSERLARANEQGTFPVVVTSSRRRRYVHTLLKAKGISVAVLSFEELGSDARPALLGVVSP